jgi:hypothetical protein
MVRVADWKEMRPGFTTARLMVSSANELVGQGFKADCPGEVYFLMRSVALVQAGIFILDYGQLTQRADKALFRRVRFLLLRCR